MGPIINEPRWRRYEEAAEEARKNGTIVTGGQRITEGDFARGLFVRAHGRRGPRGQLAVEEGAVRAVRGGRRRSTSSTRRSTKANDTEYGLTAGFFSEDRAEIDEWLDRIAGRRRVRQPARGRDHRRVAGRAAVRRLEGLGHHRQGGRRPVLRRSSTCASSRGR